MAQVVHSDRIILVIILVSALLILLTSILAAIKEMFTLKPGETDEMRRQNSEDSDGCEQSSDEEGDTGSNSGDGDSNENGGTDGYGGDNDCGAGIIKFYAIHYTIILARYIIFIMNYVSFSDEQGELVSCLTSAALISPAETSTTSCDARRCKIHQFKESKVDWVQCDGCDRWMHLFCVGIKKDDLKAMEDFYCEFC